MPGIADLMGAITGGAPIGEAPTGEAPTGADSIPENSEETGSVENDFLTGIENALSGGTQTGEDSVEDSSSGNSLITNIQDLGLGNNQNDSSGGTSASGADDMMAGIMNALSGESPAEESSPEDDTVGGSPLGDITNMPDLSNNQNDLSGGNAGSGVDDFMSGLTAAW